MIVVVVYILEILEGVIDKLADEQCLLANDLRSVDVQEALKVVLSMKAMYKLLFLLKSDVTVQASLPPHLIHFLQSQHQIALDPLQEVINKQVLQDPRFQARMSRLLRLGALPPYERGQAEFIESPSRPRLSKEMRYVAFIMHTISQAYLWILADGKEESMEEKDFLIHPIMLAVSWLSKLTSNRTLCESTNSCFLDIGTHVVQALEELGWVNTGKAYNVDRWFAAVWLNE